MSAIAPSKPLNSPPVAGQPIATRPRPHQPAPVVKPNPNDDQAMNMFLANCIKLQSRIMAITTDGRTRTGVMTSYGRFSILMKLEAENDEGRRIILLFKSGLISIEIIPQISA